MKLVKILTMILGVAGGAVSVEAQTHGHLNVGAEAAVQNAKLVFDNHAEFTTENGFVKTLVYTNAGKFAGYFQGNITLTGLHSTNAFGEPVAGAPAPGAFIQAQLVSVSGPAGGQFGFWDTNSADAPAFLVPVGTVAGTNRFDVSDALLGAGSPGGDPFGHIHGRRLSATAPGLYTIGFKVFDVSTNGMGGAPLHQPSEVLYVYFQAGYTIASVKTRPQGVEVTFGTETNRLFQLEFQTVLNPSAHWTAVGTVAGNDLLQTLIDPNPAGPARFYRILVRDP
jgi:hypothetical protein